MDVVDFREFYASRFGIATGRLIAEKLAPKLGKLDGATLMGLGYALPYFGEATESARRRLFFMQARQGVTQWPREGPIQSALVDEFDLPLLESAVDVALVIHSLELTDSPSDLLRELWRILAPQGRMLLVVPNRRGFWASVDTSPFGFGQPFSRPQLASLLKESGFSVVSWSHALFIPPFSSPLFLSTAGFWEKLGRRLMPALSGVLIVEATKQVYAIATGKRARRAVSKLRPILAPNASGRGLPF